MDWEGLGAISDTIAAIGVILSLIYLASEIRTHNKESRIASVHELNEAFRSAISSFQDPDLADVFTRAKDDFEQLPESERLQFISMFQSLFRVWEAAYHQYKQGRLNDQAWNAMVKQFAGYLSLPGIQKVWSLRKHAYSDDFRNFVDSETPLAYASK